MKHSRRALRVFLAVVFLFTASYTADGKDVWTQVRSKNFLLVGNASEKDIRKVATRLEQFRETFRLLFSRMNLTAAIPTNVVVFKNSAAYKPFKPKRADGKIDNFVAGYFQPGEDVNYITLSTEGDDKETFGTIFHEYVHFIIETNFGKSEVPPWFNEGLAEYYQTFEIAGDQKVKLGLPQSGHLRLLQEYPMMPLGQLFKISNYQLHQTADHSRSIFYAESWVLIHYLTQSGKTVELNKFFVALIKGTPPEKAFQDAFQTNYDKMEADLRKYVAKSNYNYTEVTLKTKLEFDADMRATVMDEADSNAYLGDLLYHTNRPDDAEAYLVNAVKLNPASSFANTTLGMVKIKQGKFAEARGFLEAAIAADAKNHIAYYRYAFLLTREGQDGFGLVRSYPTQTVEKMRSSLKKAMELNPAFTESYDLLAFINLVSGERMDESAAAMQTALRYQPGNQRYAMRLAEIYARQDKFAEAAAIAEKIAATADQPEVKGRAEALVNQIARRKEYADLNAATLARAEAANARRNSEGTVLIGANDPDAVLRSINEALRKPAVEEKRVIGTIQKIDCKVRPLGFTIKTPTETFSVSSVDFDSLTLNAFSPGSDTAQVGCDENLSALNAVITYRPKEPAKGTSRGDLVAVEFVPGDFRFLDPLPQRPVLKRKETPDSSMASGTLIEPPRGRNEDEEAARRRVTMQAIRDTLTKPAAGQKREIGFLEKIECTNKGNFFVFRTTDRTIRLLNSSPESLRIGVFTPELAGLQFGCSVKPIEVPAVFNYVDKPDAKSKTDGEIVALTFVPKGFTLEP